MKQQRDGVELKKSILVINTHSKGEFLIVLMAGFLLLCSSHVNAILIVGETATASTTFDAGHAPLSAVNDSKLVDGSSTPSPNGPYHQGGGGAGNWWITVNSILAQTDLDPWYTVDLGQAYQISSFDIWNYNESGGAFRGVKDVDIRYSENNPGAPTGADAPLGVYVIGIGDDVNSPGELPTTITTSFVARYVKLDINSNWSGVAGDGYGLAEIQFTGELVPEPSAAILLGLGGLLAWRGKRRKAFVE